MSSDTNEYLLAYRGFAAEPGVCHVVLPSHGATVLVGQLSDNPGTSVTNAIEEIAGALSDRLLGGQTTFRLLEYQTRARPDLQPGFSEVAWANGRFAQMPVWERVAVDADPTLAPFVAPTERRPYTLENLTGLEVIDASGSGTSLVGRLREAAVPSR